MNRDHVQPAKRNQRVNYPHDSVTIAHLIQDQCSSKAPPAFPPNRTFTLAAPVVLAACFAFGPVNVAEAGLLFGSDVLDDGLLTIDTATGAGSFVGTFPAPPLWCHGRPGV